MHESNDIRAREFDADETSDPIEDGGILDMPVRRSDFLAGAGKVGIGALGLGAFAGFAPTAFGGQIVAHRRGLKSQVIAMIENAVGPVLHRQLPEKPMRAYLAKNCKPTWKATFGQREQLAPDRRPAIQPIRCGAGDAAMILLQARSRSSGYVAARPSQFHQRRRRPPQPLHIGAWRSESERDVLP